MERREEQRGDSIGPRHASPHSERLGWDEGARHEIARAFAQARASAMRYGDAALETLFDSAYQLCVTHAEHRSAVDRYRAVYRSALDRQVQLERDACALLSLARQLVDSQERTGHIGTRDPAIVETLSSELSSVEALLATLFVDVHRAPVSVGPAASNAEALPAPTLAVHLLSLEEASIDGRRFDSWPRGRGKAIFRYLVSHRKRPVPKEMLMQIFWPDADADAARNNLNVAIYGLRKALAAMSPARSYVLFQNNSYLLNPAIAIWVDTEAFGERVAAAQSLAATGDVLRAMDAYRAATALYRSDFCADEPDEGWVRDLRQQYRDLYLGALDALAQFHVERGEHAEGVALFLRMLELDPCLESAARNCMLCYFRLGQRHLALRRYRALSEALRRELDLAPSEETVALYQRIRRGASG